MSTAAPSPQNSADDALADLAAAQADVVSRRQVRGLGISRTVVRRELRARRWQRPYPGTYVLFTGPMPPTTRVWAALLYAGQAAVASHETAAWLDGLRQDLPSTVDVSVRHGHRHNGSRPGVRVHQSRRLTERTHPAKTPPRTRIEQTVLDLTDATGRADIVIDCLLRACQRRLTTAARLRAAARGRSRLRWRALVGDVLADVRDGVLSALERRYRRDVERAHGLPRGERNQPEGQRGRRRYRDVRYRRWALLVELDGRAAHPEEWRELDDLRDNEVVETEGSRTLRYGWRSVAVTPCDTARQVARVLTSGGWTGTVRRCGPGCIAVSS